MAKAVKASIIVRFASVESWLTLIVRSTTFRRSFSFLSTMEANAAMSISFGSRVSVWVETKRTRHVQST